MAMSAGEAQIAGFVYQVSKSGHVVRLLTGDRSGVAVNFAALVLIAGCTWIDPRTSWIAWPCYRPMCCMGMS